MEKIEKVKEVLSSIREAIIIAVLILLLVFPNWINNRLTEAGFKRGSIAGFDWEAKVKESQEYVENAAKEVVALKEELGEMSSVITSLTQQPLSANTQSQIRHLKVKVDSSRQNMEQINRSLEKSLDDHKVILKDLRKENRKN